MIPDYLPILQVSQFRGDGKICTRLLDALRQEIAQKGVRVSVVGRLVQHTSDTSVDARVIEDIISTDLLVVNGPCDKDCAQLVFGHHADIGMNAATTHPRFSCLEISDVAVCADTIFKWLIRCMKGTPLYGCILIGGRSSRMGSPKHLIESGGEKSWLERSVDFLSAHVSNIVISGNGEIPQALNSLERINDLPGISGPLAGISAVVEHYPFVSWIVMA